MRKAGDVVRVDLFQNDKGQNKGCGVIEFRTEADCSAAIDQLNESDLNGRKIILSLVSNILIMTTLIGYETPPLAWIGQLQYQ
jgi:RNA recognition motif-containing protein